MTRKMPSRRAFEIQEFLVTDSALRSRLARSLHFVSGFVSPTPVAHHSLTQSRDLDSQTQTGGGEHCRGSRRQMRYSKDSDLLAPCLTLWNRWSSKGCRSGRESSRLLIGARLEMLMPHLKYIKAANLRGRCENRVGEREER